MADSGTSSPPVSIIVPARDAASTIETQLRALSEQNYAGEREVVVADNGSVDDTIERVRRWQGQVPVRVVDASDVAGPAHARNVAIASATHELVVGCDADDRVEPGWLNHMVHTLTDADLVAGGLVDWDGERRSRGEPYLLGTGGLGFLRACSSANFGVRRSAWAAVQGFSEHLATGEDIEFAWRLQLAGYRFAECADALVSYRLPDGAASTFRTWFRYGRFQPTLFRLYRDRGMPRQPVHRAVGRWFALFGRSYRVFGSGDTRQQWCREAGRRAGRLAGSVHERVLFL